MRAVLDTNVLISGVISTGVAHDVVVAGFEGEYQIVASVATLSEFRQTLQKYPDKFGMSDDAIKEEVETVRYFAEFVQPDESVTVVDDPDDNKFLEAAIAGDVEYVVSGDSHLQDIEQYRGIEIVDPRSFYERLQG